MAAKIWLNQMSRKRRRDARGASLVEAAIVMIPLCILIFGIIEFGMVFKDSLSLSNAARAGARSASAEPLNATFWQDAADAVNKQGSAATYGTGDWLCIYQVRNGTDSALADSDKINKDGKPPTDCVGSNVRKYIRSGGRWVQTGPAGTYAAYGSITGPDVCLGNPGFDSVGVALHVTHHSLTGFFGSITLNERTVMRLEPQMSLDDCTP